MQEDTDNNVIIVGAGLSGLSAADYILRNNPSIKVTILEAMDRVGGKTYTKKILGTNFDMGAQFIGRSQKYVIELANRAKQQIIPETYKGEKVLFLNGCRSTYKSNIPQNVNILALAQMQMTIWKINRMAKKVPLNDPRNCQMGNYWDSITVQTWMQKQIWSQKVRLMFATAIRIILGSELSEISMLYFLWFVHQNQSFDNLVNIENGLQQSKLKNGTQSLSFFLKEQIQKSNGKILLNQWVKTIIQSKDKIEVATSEGKKFQCKYLILATAPSVYRKIHFSPSLSSEKRYMIEKSFMGQLTKVVLLYDRQYWKQKGFSGQIVSDSFNDPILSCFDDTKYDEKGQVKQPALIVFTGAQIYRFWKQTGNLGEKISQKIAEAFQCQELKKPLAVQWFEFDEEPTLGGGPVCVMGPGGLNHIQNIRRPEGNIHFAGTQMATVSVGYMDGAIQSGIRSSQQILQKINNPQFNFSKFVDSPSNEKQINDSPWYNKLIRRTKKFFQWW